METMYRYSVFDVANWFLSKLDNITNKKLQKLVYYAYSWYLVFNNDDADNIDTRFFENKFEAWIHGAVYPDLYHHYKSHGSGVLPKYSGELESFSPDELDVLEQVAEVYGGYNGNELEAICHREDPWMTARKGLQQFEPSTEILDDKVIFNYYVKQMEISEE